MKKPLPIRWLMWGFIALTALLGGPSFGDEERDTQPSGPRMSSQPLVILPHALTQASEAQGEFKTSFTSRLETMALGPEGFGSLLALSVPVRIQEMFGSQGGQIANVLESGVQPLAMRAMGAGPMSLDQAEATPAMGVEPLTEVPGEIVGTLMMIQSAGETTAVMDDAFEEFVMEILSTDDSFEESGQRLYETVEKTTQKEASASG